MASSIIWNWKLLYSKHNFPFYLLIIELLIQKKPIVSLRLCANWAATPNLASRWCFLKREILEVENYFFMKTHDCSHEIKRRLLLGRKVMINRDSILKSRDMTLPSKVHLVNTMGFSVVMYGCESWTIKKADCWRTDAFELWCWRRLLRDPWTAWRSHQSNLKENRLNILWKDWCWSWRSNTLVTCCEELTHYKRPWCWERLKAGGERNNKGWDGWMA